ncbi:Late embryogenesis abundant (LEA) hydroxyproline-rich glycoprotein family [Striga hermonthica]|uniref:Late embryogenesis abundant (LEA) hydroxyproline-rich glycoprotein family n=1 Tax=Striga hermonthica TaxID=68872 RepID=A0A9N7RBD8_STRHE|nr:Late embryogenesis abundant (LEA) hydroxyproline-rich glycoprotein family [Striga hermonthica]
MSEKLCDKHDGSRQKPFRFVVMFLVVVLATIFITWAVLRPTKPTFTLEDATVFKLNISAPNVVSATIQVTVSAHNPNSKIGIYYEALHAYATYRGQQVTYFTTIPPAYQGHGGVDTWSPFIYGADVPVAPYNGLALARDTADGAVPLMIKVNGRVKWRVASVVTGKYHLHVTCPAVIPIGNGKNVGIVVGNAIKYQLSQSCSVNV